MCPNSFAGHRLSSAQSQWGVRAEVLQATSPNLPASPDSRSGWVVPLMVRQRQASPPMLFLVAILQVSKAACIFVITDYCRIVRSWLTACDIYAHARVCTWIPLFLTRHTCINTQKSRRAQTKPPAAVVLDILSISLCPKAPVCLMGLLTDTGWCSLTLTNTLFQHRCSHLSASFIPFFFLSFYPSSSLILLFQSSLLSPWDNRPSKTDRFHAE